MHMILRQCTVCDIPRFFRPNSAPRPLPMPRLVPNLSTASTPATDANSASASVKVAVTTAFAPADVHFLGNGLDSLISKVERLRAKARDEWG